ncbi:hypothetical protein EGT74_11430 [Chitinophaga lutea]|uniref:F5/8 type C domain-containing protein n=1 Tax=Chitinophaga lutea TaxID=2488634 RepID=A0A3N4QDQ1_9BACT|nr:DUF4998 domain-containing protein [Chitinophaga lutea]RPE14087.1 hypothetical protein EGT74_11430 [Chitinophaga lutea]
MQKYSVYSLLTMLLAILSISCSKMDATFREYVVPGGITYVGKADSVAVYPGRERLKITWRRGTDPNTRSAVVYWNNKKDSLIVPVKETNAPDVVTAMIDKLPEGTYTFQIYTRDAQNNSSIRVDVQGTSYGRIYESTILSRPISSVKISGSNVVMNWLAADTASFSTEIKFIDQAGVEQKVFLPASEDDITLPNVKEGSYITYRSLYRPSPRSLDTFYTVYESRPLNMAAGKTVKTSSAQGTNTGALAVDELTTTNWQPTDADRKDADKTVWISIDLKAPKEFNAIRFLRAGAGVLKSCKVLGSDNETTWAPLFEKTSGFTTTEDISFNTATRRYVRIEYVFETDGTFNIPEVEIYKR